MTDDADALYQLDPGEFVAERDRLAAQLRKDGRRDDAAAVKALRRPTVVAWALNQLARRHRDDVVRLRELSEQVGRAQAGGASELRELSKERRDLIGKLAGEGVKLLDGREAGSGAAKRDELIASLEVGSREGEAGDELLAGRLAKEIDAVAGFGDLFALAPSAPAKQAGPSTREVEAERRRAERAREAADAAAEAADTADARVERLEHQLADAREAAAAARARADELAREAAP